MKIRLGERVFLDTNVLLESTDIGRACHSQATMIFRDGPSAGVELLISGQVIREYLVVATRSVEKNGLGLSIRDAHENMKRFRQRTSLVAETEQVSELLLRWAMEFRIVGNRLHDLNILATAHQAGINRLLTANLNDFPKMTAVKILSLSTTTIG